MRPLRALRHSLQHASSTHHLAHPQSIERAAQHDSSQTASRHEMDMLTARRVSADPYKAWLEQREADREREAHRLNPRNAWDNLRASSYCAVGR
jgi:hypothetical protein